MEIIRELKDMPFIEKSVVTIGVFDGVHKGHQKIIKTAVETAKISGAKSIVITFEPHPLEVLKPGSHPPILTATHLKAELIEELGVDYLLILKFNKRLANLSPEKFLNEIVLKKLKASSLVVGEDFHFGKGAKGDHDFLIGYEKKTGFGTKIVPFLYLEEELVSSSNIRHHIRAGDIKKAKSLLGHWPRITGKVIKGTGIAHSKLGLPTANIKTPDKASVPKKGVYAGFFWYNAEKNPCVIHIGESPTFGILKRHIEAHIFRFNQNLYGKPVELEIRERVRDIKMFEDEKQLIEEIHEDIKKAKKILRD